MGFYSSHCLIQSCEQKLKVFRSPYFAYYLMKKSIMPTNQNGERSNILKTIEKWNRSDEAYKINERNIFWEGLKDVSKYQEEMITNGEDVFSYIFSFFRDDQNLLTALSIGCNFGDTVPPVLMAQSGRFRKIIIVDIAEGLLKRQAEITDHLHLNHIIEYKKMNLNEDSFTGNNIYDFIFSLGTIHHIERLEGLFSEINAILKKDGIFCMREYIGPNSLQFTDKQVDIIEKILSKLPDYLKTDINGNIKETAFKPSLEEIEADDPSEAVRSADIMRIANRSLKPIECKMTGGTILDSLLHGIAYNFERGETERKILNELINEEKKLIQSGTISSDYVFLIAKKRPKFNSLRKLWSKVEKLRQDII